ncbi:unnamed protein product [Closterium sp. Naga37s-1]|nr:unnamed protein product [Closterium sp. Naga37s-1]
MRGISYKKGLSRNLNGSGLTCPSDNAPCVAQQRLQSAFCRQCPSFCTTCIKPAPRSTTASPPPPTASPASPPPPSTSTSDSGGLSAAAIAGIAVAAVASLMVLLIGMLLCWRRYKKERETAQKSATADGGEDAVLQVKTDSEGLAGSVAASHCTEYSLEEVLTATSNWASDNQLSFGVLMLVVLTGRSPFGTDDGENVHILKWVEGCISSDNPASLNDLSMDAPDDAVLRLAQLALSCTVERTASRPNMAGMANELQKIRDEVVGKEEPVAAAKVDDRAREIKGLTSADAHLQCIDKILEGDSFGDHSSA